MQGSQGPGRKHNIGARRLQGTDVSKTKSNKGLFKHKTATEKTKGKQSAFKSFLKSPVKTLKSLFNRKVKTPAAGRANQAAVRRAFVPPNKPLPKTPTAQNLAEMLPDVPEAKSTPTKSTISETVRQRYRLQNRKPQDTSARKIGPDYPSQQMAPEGAQNKGPVSRSQQPKILSKELNHPDELNSLPRNTPTEIKLTENFIKNLKNNPLSLPPDVVKLTLPAHMEISFQIKFHPYGKCEEFTGGHIPANSTLILPKTVKNVRLGNIQGNVVLPQDSLCNELIFNSKGINGVLNVPKSVKILTSDKSFKADRPADELRREYQGPPNIDINEGDINY